MITIKNIKLTIEYDGTNYHGWQSQTNAVTLQDTIKNAIKELTNEDIMITGASRTDFGVHAIGQVANFFTASSIPPERFAFALNVKLPKDICVKKSEQVEDDFHSRFSTKGKRYCYLIYNEPHPSALLRNRAWHVPQKLNLDAMSQGCKHLIGTHDFSSFRAAGSNTKTSIRTITEASLENTGEIIKFVISGDGFLYNMVRIIVGTLIYVGLGKLKSDDIISIIQAKDRKAAGKTAPAQGLYLEQVFY